DNLFPGDVNELQVQAVTYTITQATCHEKYELVCSRDPESDREECHWEDTLECPADITITIKTSTLTPSANEIFSTTVADSTSTFRRIFPKVEEGAPVTCIADMPTVTDVVYDPKIGKNPGTQRPNGGSVSFNVKNIPEDSTSLTPQLTFPHLGSVYEYFLKGIQSALRPKGYGTSTVTSGKCGNNEETEKGTCKQWLFEQDGSGQYYYDKVIEAANSTTCNGKSLSPFWAIAIALNENGGLMTDDAKGYSTSHFGCNISQKQSIEDKLSCMVNTLRNDCAAGKSDSQTLQEYGYPAGTVLWPLSVLAPGTSSFPLFGSSFNTSQLITNLQNTDWVSVYGPQAATFCPSSPTLTK
ncbi:MAG: hypothetical protein GYA62_17370, partial [Bacteroidales bacterium]|nr:hypothetical protein [Bacteroidales bacterium]